MTDSEDNSEAIRKWIASIPTNLLESLEDRNVVEYGFRAGPSFIGGETWKGPSTLEEAVRRLVRYRGSLRRAHVQLDDVRLWFGPDGFERADR